MIWIKSRNETQSPPPQLVHTQGHSLRDLTFIAVDHLHASGQKLKAQRQKRQNFSKDVSMSNSDNTSTFLHYQPPSHPSFPEPSSLPEPSSSLPQPSHSPLMPESPPMSPRPVLTPLSLPGSPLQEAKSVPPSPVAHNMHTLCFQPGADASLWSRWRLSREVESDTDLELLAKELDKLWDFKHEYLWMNWTHIID
ncbi:hypothetical protein DFJ58DRAFT_843716 [Suillus subalutaceus]|uniref:uncharacterized protein n=1 Tax=Suillus subalutaceus TaxID=48586 RepID=UPI001B883B1C|nr:uncharacterized protein DFJ58DRAFT_843716 [Suillus subalutaceus]KAG1845736.1 hypothetical protein DFJ58DRAFT_843716 [Suillus subalutaceus]